MNLKRSRLRTIYLKNRTIEKDSEGVTSTTYALAGALTAEVWPISSRLQVETYGDRVTAMQNVRLKGKYTIGQSGNHNTYAIGGLTLAEGDGLCINSTQAESPDYQIVSIKPYRHLQMEVEKL